MAISTIAGIDFSQPAQNVGRQLIGVTVLVDGVGGRIVETEAYDREDPASHAFSGPTERNASMFGPPAHAYVYRSYGIHWCLNFVCEEEGSASAILIRAIQPTDGLPAMRRRRGLKDERMLCSGPGKLGEALGTTREGFNGLPLDKPPFEIRGRADKPEIATGPRIGISKAADVPWRYGLEGSPFLSKPFRS